jgi:hypothetical protein
LEGSPSDVEIRYTLDGSSPTPSSPLYIKPLEVKAACKMTAQLFSAGKPLGVPASKEFTVRAAALPQVYLDALTPVKIDRGWNAGGKSWNNYSCSGGDLIVNGHRYAHGLGLHPKAEAVFEIKPEYERFVAQVGVDDVGRQGTVKVLVYADDQLLAETPVLKNMADPHSIDVPLPRGVDGRGATKLRIVVDDAGDGPNDDHTDLFNAGFVLQK